MIQNSLAETSLKKSDFFYDLPESYIAQEPVYPRDHAKLLITKRNDFCLKDDFFFNVINYLNSGDVLVINDSKVIPARLLGRKKETNGIVETLLLRQIGNNIWETIVRPGKRLHEGASIEFGNEILEGKILDVTSEGNRIIEFNFDTEKYNSIYNVLDEIGRMPLPPYIKKDISDNNDYQTVYARELGSAAAPTAGLHFTEELINNIKEKGVIIASVLLHVGLGTFRPVKEDNIKDHKMHTEHFELSEKSSDIINNAKRNKKRIIAVGTTSCRVLESCSDEDGFTKPMSSETGIFIYPGYKFKCIDALITNFHLPESTLLMLVSAFSSREIIMNAYKHAIENNYRFFSFGDAMIIE